MATTIDWRARANRACACSHNVPSPCVGVCTMDAGTGWCRGCWRTLDEIAAWSALPDEARRAIWRQIAQRSPNEETAS